MINALTSANTLKTTNLEFNVAGEKHEPQSLRDLESKLGSRGSNLRIVSSGISEFSNISNIG